MQPCEDCGLESDVVIIWWSDHDVSPLCISCMIKRLMPIMAQAIAEATEEVATPVD